MIFEGVNTPGTSEKKKPKAKRKIGHHPQGKRGIHQETKTSNQKKGKESAGEKPFAEPQGEEGKPGKRRRLQAIFSPEPYRQKKRETNEDPLCWSRKKSFWFGGGRKK